MSTGLDSLIHRRAPSLWSRLQRSPFKTLAQVLYSLRPQRRLRIERPPLKVVCVADTHNHKQPIPLGDLLIHAGDLTQKGSFDELQTQLDWLNRQPHEHKVVIAGNHELVLDQSKGDLARPRTALDWGDLTYLEDASTTLEFRNGRSLKVYGSPWTRGPGNWAFQFKSGTDKYTEQVPDDVDVLVTHSPPRWHRDVDGHGDEFLMHEVLRVKPRLHVFGHVHAGRGIETLNFGRLEELYRDLCVGRGRLIALFSMLCYSALEMMGLVNAGNDGAQLVNAAVVGGWRDELRREPMVVSL